MRFYALLAVFAAVFISHGEATLIERAVTRTQESLAKLKLQLKNSESSFIDISDSKKAEVDSLARSSSTQLVEAFAQAQKDGKNVCQCSQQLNSASDSALEEYSDKIEECSNENMPDFVDMYSKIEKIMAEGEDLQERLADIAQECDEEGILNLCAWVKSAPLKISLIAWQRRARTEKKAKLDKIASAEKNISQCISTLLAEFKGKLRTATSDANQCILTL